MPPWARSLHALLLVASIASATACGLLSTKYEYEEELYLDIDGSVTVNVNASLASLVALHGADLDASQGARTDRERVRAMFSGPDVAVKMPTFSRRGGRRFVHVSIEADDVRQLERLAPFAWSTYRFERVDDVLVYRQVVGKPSRSRVPGVEWTGGETVAFRMHAPSRVLSDNASTDLQRGNILAWEQALADRIAGVPLDLRVEMEADSILFTTLSLFASTIAAAAITFGLIVWWVVRRGHAERRVESAGTRVPIAKE